MAGVVVDDTVRGFKFVGGMGEAGNHHHRHLAAPGKPAEAGAETDEKVCILNKIDPFLQRDISGEVFGAVGDEVPVESGTMDTFLVDAQNTVTVFLEEFHHIDPAERIVPVFRLT